MQEWFSSKASQHIQNYNKSKDVKVENECGFFFNRVKSRSDMIIIG